jgi:DNA-3-methyladenine glycosylase II
MSRLDALERDAAAVAREEPLLATGGGPPEMEILDRGFGGLIHLILGQQVSIEAADAMYAGLVAAIGPPTPERLLALDDETMRRCGFTRIKASYARGLADRVLDGFDLDAIDHMEPEDAVTTLTTLRGIGRWTAECYLLFCVGHRDVFPAGDMALQVGWQEIAGLPVRPPEGELRRIALRWAPRRSAAAHLIWDSYLRRRGRR